MKVIKKSFPRENMYPIEKLTEGRTPILFDIETTGLSPKNSCLYLIGAMVIDKEELHFIQWFAESPLEEKDMLVAFLEHVPSDACLIHFNGRGFDMPYIGHKCKDFNLPNHLASMPNIDLYYAFQPLKEYFSMTSRRLVAYEKLIGLNREDQYNGGELIEVYRDYIARKKFDKETADRQFEMLVLHNEEDIKDMLPCLALFNYLDMMEGKYESVSVTTDSDALKLDLTMFYDFPLEFTRSIASAPNLPVISVYTKGNKALITIPLAHARLKHYFSDYKNYYYLPSEDMAIHKSLAQSVDSKHRVAATKATAYTYAEGLFVPNFSPDIKPQFKADISERVSFIPPTALKDDETVRKYIKTIF